MTLRLHAFHDDALGEHDAVALAEQVRTRQVGVHELARAAVARSEHVDPQLRAVACATPDGARVNPQDTGALYGVPTYVKDNIDVVGMTTGQGSQAFTPRVAKRDGTYTAQFLSTGVTLMGKSRLPEFGLNASTEFMTQEPTRNPWNTDYSVGASSGGAAALVASGVVPIAHANDGGGSIRIPAACAGLVGLKPTTHRHLDGEEVRLLPINMVSEGVVTRSVRDTAAYMAAAENHWRNPELPPIGLVEGPARRRLRVGLLLDTLSDGTVDPHTREAVHRTATVLEQAGHLVEPIPLPVSSQFADDFLQYWGFLADLASTSGRVTFSPTFDASRTDGLVQGLRRQHRRGLHRTPGAIRRLRGAIHDYRTMFTHHELVLSPVLGTATPLLGHLSPTTPFEILMPRLRDFVAYTPLNNIAGSPAISLPAGLSPEGMPIGVHLSAAHGDERTLLETAYLLEAAQPFPTIHHAQRPSA